VVYLFLRCLRIPKPDQKRILETIVFELLGVRACAVCAVGANLRVSTAVDVQTSFGVLVLRRLNKRHAPMVVWTKVRLYNTSTRETGVRKWWHVGKLRRRLLRVSVHQPN
jgi:hypothetical protein